jgi:hypothetical protein
VLAAEEPDGRSSGGLGHQFGVDVKMALVGLGRNHRREGYQSW